MERRPTLFTMLEESVGGLAGMLIAPAFAVGTLLRGGRFLHAQGVCYQASVTALKTPPALADLAKKLSGTALVRLSNAWWRGNREWPDILGCALRFGLTQPILEQASSDAQDLLFATTPKLWLAGLSPFITKQHDYLANTYNGGVPFEIEELGLVRLELWPQPCAQEQGSTRMLKLEQAVATGSAAFVLRAQPVDATEPAVPLVEIHLEKQLVLDQTQLAFSPYRNGLGITPRGFVQAMRRSIYSLSQRVRLGHAA